MIRLLKICFAICKKILYFGVSKVKKIGKKFVPVFNPLKGACVWYRTTDYRMSCYFGTLYLCNAELYTQSLILTGAGAVHLIFMYRSLIMGVQFTANIEILSPVQWWPVPLGLGLIIFCVCTTRERRGAALMASTISAPAAYACGLWPPTSMPVIKCRRSSFSACAALQISPALPGVMLLKYRGKKRMKKTQFWSLIMAQHVKK